MSIRATFSYFQGMEGDMYQFYRIPKLLFTSEYFKNLSCEAKVLYGLMLDRMSLSIKNRWLDEEDRVYIFFSVEEIMEMLNTAKKILKEDFNLKDFHGFLLDIGPAPFSVIQPAFRNWLAKELRTK